MKRLFVGLLLCTLFAVPALTCVFPECEVDPSQGSESQEESSQSFSPNAGLIAIERGQNQFEDRNSLDRAHELMSTSLSSIGYFVPTSQEGNLAYIYMQGLTPVAYFGPSEVCFPVWSTDPGNASIEHLEYVNITFEGSSLVSPVQDVISGPIISRFYGNDPSKWQSGVHTSAELRYPDLYPGVDLVFEVNQGGLKYYFRVQPGGDARDIHFMIHGAANLEVLPNGTGYITTTPCGGTISDSGLRAWVASDVNPVEIAFVQQGASRLGITVGPYPLAEELIIDPILFSTYVGGSLGDICQDMAMDVNGCIYLTGYTYSNDFPTTPGAYDRTVPEGDEQEDVFVVKLDSNCSTILYCTYLNDDEHLRGNGIVVDAAGQAYIVGSYTATGFPTTTGAYDTNLNGPSDGFLSVFSANGSNLVYSTYLGGNGGDLAIDIALDVNENAIIVGTTTSTDFPTTSGAYNTTLWGSIDIFFMKLNASGAGAADLLYSSYMGGENIERPEGCVLDSAGNVYCVANTESLQFPITPSTFDASYNGGSNDVVVIKMSLGGQGLDDLLYSTYLGGSNLDFGYALTVDFQGQIYVTGITNSINFPTTTGAFDRSYHSSEDIFVTVLNSTGTGLNYSTYIGGNFADVAHGITVDCYGSAYLTGFSQSLDFPTTAGAMNSSRSSNADAIFCKLTPQGNELQYSTFIRGESGTDCGFAILLNGTDTVILAGYASDGFPTTPGANDTTFNGADGWAGDTFVTAISILNPPAIGGISETSDPAPNTIDQDLTFSVTAGDSALETVTVFYHVDSQAWDSNRNVTWSGGVATIPKEEFIAASTVHYYVAAHDVANLTTFRGAGNVTWIENRTRNNPLSFAVIDLAPPDIGAIGGLVDPVPDPAAQNLSFTVTEVGPGAVAWARLYYRSEGQAWDSGRYVTWTDGWTNISSAVYVYNEKIFYYAAAQDTNGNTNYRGVSGITTSEAAAQAEAFNFSINDVTPPEIGSITEGWDPVAEAVNQTLACVITDLPNGLDWACAFYRNGSEAWDAGRYVNFTAGAATFWSDSYKNSSTVYYYIAARDKAGHLTFRGATGMVATEGDAQADPCSFGVTHPPPPAFPTGTITLYYPGLDLPFGGTTVDIASHFVTDTNGQTVGAGTKFTISTTCGTILASDVDPTLPGVQLYSSGGRVSFQVQLPAGSGGCVLSITSVQGDAAGTFNLEYVASPAFPFEIVIYAGITGCAAVVVTVVVRRVKRRRFLI